MIRSSLWTAVAVVALSVPPYPAAGQCSKQILAYLDSSGSMKPGTPKTPAAAAGSPYFQTLDALRRLFDQPQLVGPGDGANFFRFGETVISLDHASGEDIRLIPGRLLDGHGAESESDTNLLNVFGHLAEQLKSGDFKRKLVVIASDFAHDPRRPRGKRSARDRIDDWNGSLAKVRDEILTLFPREGERAVMLLVAPVAPGRSRADDLEVRNQVVGDLEKLIPDADLSVATIGPGTAADEIAKDLAGLLLNAPAVHLYPGRPGTDGAAMIANPNCVPLTITGAAIDCRSAKGTTGASQVPHANGISIPQGGSFILAIPANLMANCAAGDDLAIALNTAQRSSPTLTKVNLSEARIDFAPRVVVTEWNLLGQHLHTFLDLSGYLPPDHHLAITLQETRGDKPVTLSTARFMPERPLGIGAPHLYRADLDAGWLPRFDPDWNLSVHIEGASESPKSVALSNWSPQTWTSFGPLVAGFALLIFALFSLARHGRTVDAGAGDPLHRVLKLLAPATLVLPFIAVWLLSGKLLFHTASYFMTWLLTSIAIGLLMVLLRNVAINRRVARKSLRTVLGDAAQRRETLTLAALKDRYADLRQTAALRHSAPLWGIFTGVLILLLALGLLQTERPFNVPHLADAELLTRLSD